MKQSYYEPGMPRDVLFNNNVPAGIWDDTEENGPLSEFQDLDDYPQYYQPACEYPFKLTISKQIFRYLFTAPRTHKKRVDVTSFKIPFCVCLISNEWF